MIGTRAGAPFLLAAAVLVFAGCGGDDPVKIRRDPEGEDPIPWPDMTEAEDAIETLRLCYENPELVASMEKYEQLLHSQYCFYLHKDDVKPGQDSLLTLIEDIASTEWMFANQTDLFLWIAEEGSWLARDDIGGDSCENCWETTRAYYIRAQFAPIEGVIFSSPPERAYITIVVVPGESDPSKWVIREMYDIIAH